MENLDHLPDEIYAEISRLAEAGNLCFDEGELQQAIDFCAKAVRLLPPPIEKWETATWLLGSMGDVYFQMGDYLKGKSALAHCMHCPDAIGNPFLHLRLGQCLFELDDMTKSSDELMRAYMGGGTEIFEDEDPKYLNSLGAVANL